MDEAIVTKLGSEEFQELAPATLQPSPDTFIICITDLVMKCLYDGSEQDVLDALVIQILGAADQNEAGLLHLEKLDENDWKYNGKIERTITNEGITLVAQSVKGSPLGHIQLASKELGEFQIQGRLNDKLTHILEADMKGFILRISFTISNASEIGDMVETGFQKIKSSIKNEDKNNGIELAIEHANIDKEKSAINTGNINTMLQEHEDQGSEQAHIADELLKKFEHTGDLTDISGAISIYQKAINLTPKGHLDMSRRLESLGNAFSKHFDHTRDLTDISEAISIYQQAINLTPEGHSFTPILLTNLAAAFRRKFGQTRNLKDITEAISMYRKSIGLTPEEDSSILARLASLTATLDIRYRHTGKLADNSEAISLCRKSLSLMPEEDPNMPALLGNLANALGSRFWHTGDLTNISEAISMDQKAIQMAPDGHPLMPMWLHNLASSLADQGGHTGNLADIAEAISMYQKGINLIPEGHSDMHTWLRNLASTYHRKFGHTGNLTDIAEAISIFQKSISLTPEGDSSMPLGLGNLAAAFTRRFENTEDITDITEAISLYQQGISLTPEKHPFMPAFLSNLAIALNKRFIHKRDLRDILEAISMHNKAVNLTPERHSSMPIRLGNLATAYLACLEHTGDLADVSKAISIYQKVINLTPEGHPDMFIRLGNLASAFRVGFKHTKDLTDISKAISINEKAIGLMPEGHPGMSFNIAYLAEAFHTQFKHTKDISTLEAAVSHWHQCAILSSGTPSNRLKAARQWATISEQVNNPHQTLKAYDVAIGLLLEVLGMQKTVQRQYSDLANIAGFPRQAAAYACSIGRPDKAIEWLEQGRCLVWSQLNNLRSPLDELHDCQPHLADELRRTSRQLELAASQSEHAPSSTMAQQISQQQEAFKHLKLAKERDQLLAKIRDIPQFKNFLQPQSCSELLNHLPKSGHVVVINVYKSHCDALAITPGLDIPLHIPLPEFSLQKAEDLYQSLQIYMGNNRGDKLDASNERKFSVHVPGTKPGMQHILGELWHLVVKPIIRGLGYLSPPTELSHIWWCATGPLALLPIHAAGIYSTLSTGATPSACTLSDFAISSYIPTITALTTRAKNRHQMQNQKRGLFMISQPDTPGCSPIPGTSTEVRAIKEQLKPNNIQVACLEGNNATVEQVLVNMDTHSCIHFACHASQHPNQPLESAFFLHDGKLKLSTIIQKNLKGADLAFLSACQTSVGDKILQDEAVHLAAGMLAAGYQGVVATMWSIKDDYAPQIAEDFYVQLMSEAGKVGHKDLDGSNAAFAIHHAIQKLRKTIGDTEASLSVWVPYVHFGL